MDEFSPLGIDARKRCTIVDGEFSERCVAERLVIFLKIRKLTVIFQASRLGQLCCLEPNYASMLNSDDEAAVLRIDATGFLDGYFLLSSMVIFASSPALTVTFLVILPRVSCQISML